MLNSASFVGRLGQAPDLRQTNSGRSFLSGAIAVGRNFKNQNGEYDTDWIDFQAWGNAAEYLAKYAGKGSVVSMSGRIQTRTYENQQGNKVKVTELIAEQVNVLQSNSNQNNQQGNDFPSGNSSQNDYQSPFGNSSPVDISDSDLPF